jgi:hypothetical protein
MANVQGDEAGLEDDLSPEEGPVDPEDGVEADVDGGGDEDEEEDVDGLASFLESEILSGSSAEDTIDVSAFCLSSPFDCRGRIESVRCWVDKNEFFAAEATGGGGGG